MKIKFLPVILLILSLFGCDKSDDVTNITNNYYDSIPANGLKIGDIYQGGIIFYIDGTGKHGLICSTYDLADTVRFFPLGGTTPADNGVLIGTGKSNTSALVSLYGPGNYGAYICDTLNINGYSDWFLPSRDEIMAMVSNLHCNGKGNIATGEWYLSSSRGLAPSSGPAPVGPYNISLQTYSANTNCYSFNISVFNRVRAVRNF